MNLTLASVEPGYQTVFSVPCLGAFSFLLLFAVFSRLLAWFLNLSLKDLFKTFQHMWSFKEYRHIFNCHSNINITSSTWSEQFLAYDIIIFDFGLMHRILGTTECVANYLDGGYMRCAWCVQQASALVLLIVVLLCIPRPVWLLWPGRCNFLFIQK